MRRFKLLVRHLLNRMMCGDHLKFENQNRESFIVLLALLAVLGGYMAHKLYFPYLLNNFFYGFSAKTLWQQRVYFITLSMAVTGIVGVINWENMFLDRKDYHNLAVLPIPLSILYGAKFTAVLLYVGLVSAIFNSLALPIAAVYVTANMDVSFFSLVASQLVGNFAANLAIFLAVALVQAGVSMAAKGKLLDKVGQFMQTLLFFVFVSVFAWFPALFPSLAALKAQDSWFVYLFPPFWFTGLGETVAGGKDAFFAGRGLWGALVLTVLVVLYLSSMPRSYKHYLQRAWVAPPKRRPFRLLSRWGELFDGLFLKNRLNRAAFYFSLQTLRRSRKHKFYVIISITLPLSLLAAELVYTYIEKGATHLNESNLTLISLPLILFTSLVLGLRLVVNRPLFLEANWIFKVTGNKDHGHFVSGFKRAVFTAVFLPLVILLVLLFAYFWNLGTALLHISFCLTVCMLLLELFFFHYHKVPFAAEYRPGKADLKIYLPFYVAGFAYYLFLLCVLACFLLDNPNYYALFFALAAVILSVIKIAGPMGRQKKELVYEDNPPPVFLTLGLDNEC